MGLISENCKWRAAPSERTAPVVSRKSGPAPPVGTGPEVLRGMGGFKLLAAKIAQQNSTAREKPVHSIKPT
jgi:hypothetical protein